MTLRSMIIALASHGVWRALLCLGREWSPAQRPQLAAGQEPVKARVIDDAAIRAAAAEKARKEAIARKKAAAEKARREEAARRKAAAEEARRKEAARKKAAVEKARREQAARKKAAAEKARKEAIARKKAAAEKARREEAARRKAAAEKARREEAARQAAQERALEEQLLAEEQEQEARRLAAARERKERSLINHYMALIQQKVERNWIRPPGSARGLVCTVQVRLMPGGGVVRATIGRSSGDDLYDRSVVNAVYKASPLPLPADAALFDRFRELEFLFNPEG